MSEVYNGYFVLDDNNIMQAQCSEAVTAPDKLAAHLADLVPNPVYGVGSGWDAYSEQLSVLKSNEGSPEVVFPTALAMLTIGADKFKQGMGVSAEEAQPVYVRDTVSWKKLPGRE
jgi:tRNA threonylcarbamoyladenosine biosynthesis protein TsaB